MGHEERRVYQGRDNGMAGIDKMAYGIGEAGMKIIIGGQDIEVPQFMADTIKKPENGRQFHAFKAGAGRASRKSPGRGKKKNSNP
jgi:hypothetical protein